MGRFDASLQAYRRVLANRRIRKLQIAAVGSTLGSWAYAVALPVYAFHAGGTRAVGVLFAARFVIGALAAPWFGLLADRWSRRRLMLAADVVRAGIFAGMTVVALAGGSPYVVYVLAVSSVVVGCAYQPAQGALLPLLVDTPEELTAANLVNSSISSIGMFVGPALSGVLLVLSGPAAVFALNGALLVWSAVFVVQVPPDEPPQRAERPRLLPELSAGLAAVVRRPALRVVVGLTAAQTLVWGVIEVLLVVVALRLLHAGNAGVGWLNCAIGVGSLVGGAAVAVIAARRRLAGGFALGILVMAIPVAVAAALSTLAPALVLFALMGAGSVLVEVGGMTLLQRSAENEVLGRVFALLGSLTLGALAVGSVLAAGLVGWLGLRGALVVTGVALPVLLVPLWPTLRRIDAEAEPASEPLALLRAIAFFGELPEPVLERLAGGATAVTAAPGRPIVTQGDPGHHFYVLAEGHADVEVEGETPRRLGPGDFFGEIALLRDVPRTATVRAADTVRVYAIARTDFLAAVTGHSPTLAAAESVVVSRLPAGALSG